MVYHCMLTSLQCFTDTASGAQEAATTAARGSSTRLVTHHTPASLYVNTLSLSCDNTGTVIS